MMSRQMPAKVSGRGLGGRVAGDSSSRRGKCRPPCARAGTEVGDALGLAGVGRAHQPAQQLFLQAFAEQVPAGGGLFLLSSAMISRNACSDVGQGASPEGDGLLRSGAGLWRRRGACGNVVGQRARQCVRGIRRVSGCQRRSAAARSGAARARARSRQRRGALELGARLVERGRAWPAGRRARWAAGGSPSSAGSRRSASTSARPAAGPERHRRRATARLSSTTGDGATLRERGVERGDARPVGVARRVRARAWQAAIAACSAYGPRAPPSASARVERGQAAADQQLVPARAVLVEQQDRLARRADARARAREAWISISATRPCTSGSSGASSARMRPRRSASSHSAGRIQSSPAVAE